MKNALRFTAVLGLICVAAGLGVSAVYQLTRGRIQAKKEQAFAAALSDVFPDADNFLALDSQTPWEGDGVGVAMKGADVVGYLAVGEKQGYSSKIRVLVGAAPDLSIRAVKVLQQSETPGLGERTKEVRTDRTVWRAAGEAAGIVEKISGAEDTTPWFQKQFEGLTLEKLVIVKDPGAEGIHAITGATISSQAVTDAVRDALSLIAERQEKPGR
jgi:electron transport complex protein RnfG